MKIEDLLAESRKFTASFKTPKPVIEIEEVSLPWKRSYTQALTPVGYEWADCIVHFYFDELDFTPEQKENITIIIHGHSRTSSCAAPTQCHVLGWLPVGNEPEPFLKYFERFKYG